MKVLFDQNVPKNLIPYLIGHDVTRSYALGWQDDKDGTLLEKAEAAGFQILVTGDKNIVHQQNLAGRAIAIVELGRTNWPQVKPHVDRIATSVNLCVAGTYLRVVIGA